MKKILILTAAVVFSATSCFAIASGDTGTMTLADGTTGLDVRADAATATATTALIGKTSTGVGVGWNTDVNGYALVTQHKSGTKAYGSSYDSTALFQTIADGTPGTVILGVPTATDTTDFADTADWKQM
jgi:hypothetical protein